MRLPGNDERGPRGMGTASSVVQAGEAKISLAPEADIVVDGAPAHVVFDNRWMAGYEAGYAHGIDRGRQLADDEAQWPMRLAEQHIRHLADVEPHEDRWRRAVGA